MLHGTTTFLHDRSRCVIITHLIIILNIIYFSQYNFLKCFKLISWNPTFNNLEC